jgi:hypothetical protein
VCEQDLWLDYGGVKFDKTEDINAIDLAKFVYELIPWLLRMNPILEAHFPSTTCWCPKFIIRFWEHVICYSLWRGFSDPAQVLTCAKDQIRNVVVQWSKCVVVAETGICHAATDWLKMSSPYYINDMLGALIVNSANPSCAIFLKRFVSS